MKIILFDGGIIVCNTIEFTIEQKLFVDEEIIIDPKKVVKIVRRKGV